MSITQEMFIYYVKIGHTFVRETLDYYENKYGWIRWILKDDAGMC